MQVRIEAMGPRRPDYRYGCSFPTAIRIRTLEGDAKFEGIFRRRDHESSQASQVDGRMQAPTYKRESPADGMLLRCDLILRETVVEYNKWYLPEHSDLLFRARVLTQRSYLSSVEY